MGCCNAVWQAWGVWSACTLHGMFKGKEKVTVLITWVVLWWKWVKCLCGRWLYHQTNFSPRVGWTTDIKLHKTRNTAAWVFRYDTAEKKVSSETHSSHNTREGNVSLFNCVTIRLCELDFLSWKQRTVFFVSQSKLVLRVYHLKQQWCVQSSWEA